MMDKTFYVINEDGIRVDAKVLSKFKLSNNKDYITYTYNETNPDGMVKIYVTGMSLENGVYTYSEILTDEEWSDIKTVLKTLARSSEEPFPESIKSDLKVVGEELSIRKPRKLLVSKKFADVLEGKYVEEKDSEPVVNNEPVAPVAPVVTKIEEKESELEKTIKIPTFEELQARNKNIQAAMETVVTPEPAPEPKAPVYESRVKKVDYEEKFKKDVEPVLLDVYAQQQKHIEELEEELSKTKFDLFEKQKEALSLSNEKEEMERKTEVLEQQLDGVQRKMNGILSVLQDTK